MIILGVCFGGILRKSATFHQYISRTTEKILTHLFDIVIFLKKENNFSYLFLNYIFFSLFLKIIFKKKLPKFLKYFKIKLKNN